MAPPKQEPQIDSRCNPKKHIFEIPGGISKRTMAAILERATVDEVLETGLLTMLDNHLLSIYPKSAIFGIDHNEFRQGGGVFVLAREDGEAVGCGAVRGYDEETTEIKRMFVRPEYRGQGIAREILRWLEAEAVAQGYRWCLIETGRALSEAVALYLRSGYREIEKFGPYVDCELSVCFAKRL
jgi:GNAT superfamily N-acetyltransferase